MSFYGAGPGLYLEKDPDDIEDAVIDFSLWVGGGTLQSHTVAVASGVTVVSSSINAAPLTVTENGVDRIIATSKAVTVRLSGGTPGAVGLVTVRAVAVDGRQRDVSFKIVPRAS